VVRAEAYLHAKFHLDPSNRLATVHERHIQDRQTERQRTDSIGRTVLQTVAQKCYANLHRISNLLSVSLIRCFVVFFSAKCTFCKLIVVVVVVAAWNQKNQKSNEENKKTKNRDARKKRSFHMSVESLTRSEKGQRWERFVKEVGFDER